MRKFTGPRGAANITWSPIHQTIMYLGTISSALTFVLLFIGMTDKGVRGVEVQEYFPGVSDDLGVVTWAHAVNSKALLEEALDGDIMMLEADVVLGVVTSSKDIVPQRIPIMAHPPDRKSDLSLHEFLERVINATTREGAKKGIKLDFKSLEVLDPALTELDQVSEQITFPVWLNADILQGPVDSTKAPVDAESFLVQCKERFPTSTLSTGWTTRFGLQNDGTNVTEGKYTQDQVDEMTSVLQSSEITQPVTFPVRSGIAAHSGTELLSLVDRTANSTLTLWSPEDDPVDVDALRSVLDLVGRDRVYIDVPEPLRDALMNSSVMNAVAAPALLLLSSVAALAR